MLELVSRVVPATVACMKVLDVSALELVPRLREGVNHYDSVLGQATPRQPRKSRGTANEQICVLDEVDTLLQRDVTREVLCSVWHPVVRCPCANFVVSVYAQHTVAILLEMLDDLTPA